MNRSLDSVQKNIRAMRAEAEGLALGLAIRAAANFIKTNLDLAGSLGETAQQIGVTTRELQVYRALGLQVGIANEEMDAGLAKLTVSLGKASVGAKAQGDAFAALGISVRDSSDHVKTAGGILPEIADRLSKVADPAQRAAAEIAIFGRAGQKLDTILTGGKKGIEDYTKRAEDMGLILSDELVTAADAASDRIAELNAQLKVNIAGAVAQNANAILGLANALVNVTTRALQFISTYPRLSAALAGAALGARGGLPGMMIGGAAGAVIGNSMAGSAADGNMDLGFRRNQLNLARGDLERMRNPDFSPSGLLTVRRGGQGGGGLQAAIAETQKQTRLTGQAIAAARAPELPALPGELPNFLAGGGGGGGGRSRRAPKDDTAEKLAKFQQDLSRLNVDLLRAKQRNLTDVEAIAAIDVQQIQVENSQLESSINADIAAKKYTQAQGDQLKALGQQVMAQQLLTVDIEKAEELAKRSLNVQFAANDNEKDLLSAQEQLVMTAAARRPIQLRMLELEKEEERLKLQSILASKQATEAEKQIAQARLNSLGAIYGARQQSVMNNTAGPLENYRRNLATTPEQINEAIENIKVQGLDALNQGLVDAIMGVRSLGDVFKSVATQIIADLLRIQIKKMIVGLLGNVLGVNVPNAAGVVKNASTKFADGGAVHGPGTGTSDSIIARLSNGEFVMSAAAVSRIGAGTLSAMNSGTPTRFASGGHVGRPSPIPYGSFTERTTNIRVEASPFFDVRVNGQIARAAPAIADAGANMGLARSAYRQSRRVA